MIAPKLVSEPPPDPEPERAEVAVGLAEVLTPVMRAPSEPVLVKVTVTTGIEVGVVTDAAAEVVGAVVAAEVVGVVAVAEVAEVVGVVAVAEVVGVV